MNTAAKADKGHATIIKKVSKKGHDEAHGGAWKVAFADFVLALMCLFLVLWILAARSSRRPWPTCGAPRAASCSRTAAA